MRTLLINPANDINTAIEILANGNPIAFPTETVFGIGADIFNAEACSKIYDIKSRDIGKPLSAHVSSIAMAESLILNPNELFHKLAEKFLPGPLAIICPKNHLVSDAVTAGLNTISIRYPSHPDCLTLIDKFGKPLAATSANISGEKSLDNSNDVMNVFSGAISAIIIGECSVGIESTIISIVDSPKIFRIGAISREEIEDYLNCKTY